jgi:hypothetical protein
VHSTDNPHGVTVERAAEHVRRIAGWIRHTPQRMSRPAIQGHVASHDDLIGPMHTIRRQLARRAGRPGRESIYRVDNGRGRYCANSLRTTDRRPWRNINLHTTGVEVRVGSDRQR